jgi:hypothetical protein
MKKLIAISSVLALTVAGSGLFAFDILNGDGEKSGFSLDMQAKYAVDIITEDAKEHDNDKTWIEEADADKQAKVSIGVSYDGDNYAFGVGTGFEQSRTDGDSWYLDNAWGKYYLMGKQLWLRGGSMDGLWRIDTDPLNKNYGGDNGPGFQINFASEDIGLNVGVALPVPKAEARKFEDSSSTEVKENWAPTYPLMNMVFGLRLSKLIDNFDFGAELDLLGMEPTNGKYDTDRPNEKEGDFKGVNFHLTAVYAFAPITVKAALVGEGFANAISNAPDPLVSAGARVIFDIPNAEGSPFDLGDPWVQFQMLPNGNETEKDGVTAVKKESFKDMEIAFEWEPSYSIVPDQLKVILWFGVNYKSWAYQTDNQEKHPLKFAVRPALEFKFAPNATLKVQDEMTFIQQEKEKGLKNVVGFRFAWAF